MAQINEIPDFRGMVEKLKSDAVRFASITGLNFFRESFFNKGFTNSSFEAWTPNKTGTTILTKTGNLRDSLKILERSQTQIIFGTDAPQAQIHNEGGIINVPITEKSRRFFWYMYKASGQEHWKWMALSKSDTLKVRIPKRQFIGHSETLMNELDVWLIAEINKRFSKL